MTVAIVTICLIILFFISLILRHIYRKKNHLPTGECACCKKRMLRAVKSCQKNMSKTNK